MSHGDFPAIFYAPSLFQVFLVCTDSCSKHTDILLYICCELIN